MKKTLFALFALLFVLTGLAFAAETPATPAPPTAAERPAPHDEETGKTGPVTVDLVEGPLASIMVERTCTNIGGSCSSHSQCGFIGFCEGGRCVCECNYGARCTVGGAGNCGYAGYCNYNGRCACY